MQEYIAQDIGNIALQLAQFRAAVDEAKKRIAELEEENATLKAEIEKAKCS